MEIGMTKSGQKTAAHKASFHCTAKRIKVYDTTAAGSLAMTMTELVITFWRTPKSPMRDISSPVLAPPKKLKGRLSRCSKARARRSAMARTTTQLIR